jgi:hypothetical protein
MWWRQYEDGNTARQGIQVIEQIVAATKRFGFVESTNNISGRSQPSVGRDYLVSPALFRQRVQGFYTRPQGQLMACSLIVSISTLLTLFACWKHKLFSWGINQQLGTLLHCFLSCLYFPFFLSHFLSLL